MAKILNLDSGEKGWGSLYASKNKLGPDTLKKLGPDTHLKCVKKRGPKKGPDTFNAEKWIRPLLLKTLKANRGAVEGNGAGYI